MCQPWHYNISTTNSQGKAKGSIICEKTCCSKVAPNYHKVQRGEKGGFVAITNNKTTMEMETMNKLRD